MHEGNVVSHFLLTSLHAEDYFITEFQLAIRSGTSALLLTSALVNTH